MSDRIKDLLIGIFVIAAVVITIGMIMFLKPSYGDGKEVLIVRFTDINKINVGTRVILAGKAVGEVKKICVIKDARTQPADKLGRVYYYQLTLKVDSHVKVYNTDDITLQTSGLLGERSVSIIPKAPPKGMIPKLIPPGQPIYGDAIDPIENTMYEVSNLATDMQETFTKINNWIDENEENLSSAVRGFDTTMNQLGITITNINDCHLIDDIDDAVNNVGALMADLNEGVDDLLEHDAFNNLGLSIESIKNITQSIDMGKGTIGRLINQDDLYIRATNLVNKANQMMDDINQYGLLFQQNKSWQRQNKQRQLETGDCQ